MTSQEIVVLRGGLYVSVDAVRLAIDLEGRGVELRLDGRTLVARPRHLLSDEDVAHIKAVQADLKILVAYEVPCQ